MPAINQISFLPLGVSLSVPRLLAHITVKESKPSNSTLLDLIDFFSPYLSVVLSVIDGLALLVVLGVILGLALLLVSGVVHRLIGGLALLLVHGVVLGLALLLVDCVALKDNDVIKCFE